MMPGKDQDRHWMNHALRLAAKGLGAVSPNPMVGAVIVRGGRLVASGWHRRFGGHHAEVEALNKAGARARGATMFVTLEPCYHTGKTPPCVDALIAAGIKKVVMAMKDPNPLTNGRSVRKLRRAGIEVTVGILGDEARRLNRAFLFWIEKGRPLVTVKSAQTLDGRIAAAGGQSKWITSDESRAYARRRRREFDAILVGVETVRRDDPLLDAQPVKPSLRKVVLDPTLRSPLQSRMFDKDVTAPDRCLVLTTQAAPAKRLASLARRGVGVMVYPRRVKEIPWPWILNQLARLKVTSLLIEGGAKVISGALAAGVVDRVHVYTAPKIMGDERGAASFQGRRIRSLKDCLTLDNIVYQSINQDWMVEADVHRNR